MWVEETNWWSAVARVLLIGLAFESIDSCLASGNRADTKPKLLCLCILANPGTLNAERWSNDPIHCSCPAKFLVILSGDGADNAIQYCLRLRLCGGRCHRLSVTQGRGPTAFDWSNRLNRLSTGKPPRATPWTMEHARVLYFVVC